MKLHRTQALFARTMLSHPASAANPPPQMAELFVSANYCLTERLAIYRNNVVGSLTDALLATYPLIKSLTGEDYATSLMRSYVMKNPPLQACLAQYGAGLDRFIEDIPPARSLPYLADVARLEWAINEAFYAKDDDSLSPRDIESAASGHLAELSLRLRSSVSLINSRWPLSAIRNYCLNHEDSTELLNLDQEGGPLIIYRPHLSVEIAHLHLAEFHLLNLLPLKTLGEALEEVLRIYPDFDFLEFFQRHLLLETFSSLTAKI